MGSRFIGVFVRDVATAKDYMNKLSKKGYSVDYEKFEAFSDAGVARIFPMSTMKPENGCIEKLNRYLFDEVLIPSWISYNYEQAIKRRLRDLNSLVKIYKE